MMFFANNKIINTVICLIQISAGLLLMVQIHIVVLLRQRSAGHKPVAQHRWDRVSLPTNRSVQRNPVFQCEPRSHLRHHHYCWPVLHTKRQRSDQIIELFRRQLLRRYHRSISTVRRPSFAGLRCPNTQITKEIIEKQLNSNVKPMKDILFLS